MSVYGGLSQDLVLTYLQMCADGRYDLHLWRKDSVSLRKVSQIANVKQKSWKTWRLFGRFFTEAFDAAVAGHEAPTVQGLSTLCTGAEGEGAQF